MSYRRGFTLVEQVIVVVLIAILMALLLPAIQSSRESARRVQCKNQLRQLGQACLLHEIAQRHLPTGGWGFDWNPDPDSGFSRKQPGTWTYNILPFLEEKALHAVGADGLTNAITPEQNVASAKLLSMPLPVFHCPSRRPPQNYPQSVSHRNANPMERIAKGDYAACAGELFLRREVPAPPRHLADWRPARDSGGVCFQKSMVRSSQITDGTSKTYLIGEKSVPSSAYMTQSVGELYGMWCFDWGNIRVASAHELPCSDSSASGGDGLGSFCFGSAHPTSWNVVLCDASVHTISYDIDGKTHGNYGNRRDAITPTAVSFARVTP